MSNAYIKLEIVPNCDLNELFRLLKLLDEMIEIDNISFEVD